MFANTSSKTFVTEIANHHPEFERSKTSTELNAIVRTASHFFLFRRSQVLGHKRECPPEQIHVTRIQNRKVERREQPLMWINDYRVSSLATSQDVTQLRNNSGRTSIRSIHVQPHRMLFTNGNNLRNRINTRCRRGAC